MESLTTFDKLNQETAKIEWKALERFFAQGRILVVANDADLVKTAATIADNQAKKVEQWIKEEIIMAPDIDWVKKYCQPETLFWAVVVAPWVIIQSTQGDS